MATVEQMADLVWERFVNQTTAFTYMWFHDGKQGYSKPTRSLCETQPCRNCKYGRCQNTENQPLTKEDMIEHIRGNKTLAPYQLSTENTVKYMEFDVDIQKNGPATIEQAQETVIYLCKKITRMFGPYSCMVEISGSKGYHIWMFFNDQLAARYAYALGHYIAESREHPDGIEVEVFPKQVTQTGYGSATRLPFGIHRKTNVRGVIVDNTFTPHKDQYEAFKRVISIDVNNVFEVLQQNNIPVPDSIRRDAGKGHTAYLCISRLMTEGPTEGQRDELMYRLGCYLRERGFDEETALVVMKMTNDKSDYPLDDQTIISKMLSAFRADFSGMPCFRVAFDPYCSSTCPIFENKAKWRHLSIEELKKKVRD